jgi:nitroreductase
VSELGVFDAIRTTRAMRHLKTDPVADDLIDKILAAGLAAPTGGNNQNWGFVVCKDPEIKRRVQPYYKQALMDHVLPHYHSQLDNPPPGMTKEQFATQIERVIHLTDHFHEAPVWIVACLQTGQTEPNYLSGASIYPAVQNMLLAARTLGLGATLTTRHGVHAKAVDEIFGLPEGVRSYAILPIGYPEGNFGPVTRGELSDVVYLDRWGQPYPRLA